MTTEIDRFGVGTEPCVCERAPKSYDCDRDCRCMCWHLTQHRLLDVQDVLEVELSNLFTLSHNQDCSDDVAWGASQYGVAVGLRIAAEHPEIVPLLIRSHEEWYRQCNEGRISPAEIASAAWPRQ